MCKIFAKIYEYDNVFIYMHVHKQFYHLKIVKWDTTTM